ncbi:MAG: ATPase [Gaiellales bacterium]|nr:ATPase [Gaiellales bacterium]
MEGAIITLAAAVAISLPAMATAWAQSKIGAAGVASLVEKPEMAGTVIIMLAIPETMAILGFVVAVIIMLQGG